MLLIVSKLKADKLTLDIRPVISRNLLPVEVGSALQKEETGCGELAAIFCP